MCGVLADFGVMLALCAPANSGPKLVCECAGDAGVVCGCRDMLVCVWCG